VAAPSLEATVRHPAAPGLRSDSLPHIRPLLLWSESFGQIHPALAELDRQALVERRRAERTGSSTFAITPAGTARLRELLSRPAQPSPPRNGLLLRLFFGRQLGPEACRRLVEGASSPWERYGWLPYALLLAILYLVLARSGRDAGTAPRRGA
jgi:hypothetical protein